RIRPGDRHARQRRDHIPFRIRPTGRRRHARRPIRVRDRPRKRRRHRRRRPVARARPDELASDVEYRLPVLCVVLPGQRDDPLAPPTCLLTPSSPSPARLSLSLHDALPISGSVPVTVTPVSAAITSPSAFVRLAGAVTLGARFVFETVHVNVAVTGGAVPSLA